MSLPRRQRAGTGVPSGTISAAELLAALPGLRDVESTVVDQMARASIVRRYATGDALYRAGDPADGLYIVLSGKVLVSRETAARSEMLHSESAGGVLGEIPVFGGGCFPATATAVEPTRCAHLQVDVINRLLREHSTFVTFALRRLASRAESLLRRIDELTATTITSRIAAYLVQRSGPDRSAEFTLGKSQAQLAAELGTAREVVVRGLASLIAAGAIRRVGRSRFAVAELHVLRSIAGLPG